MSERSVLAGDIGGTKCNLGLFAGTAAEPVAVAVRGYPSRDFSGVDEVVRRFLAETGGHPVAACFGVAGAIVEGRVHLPNLGWSLSEAALAQALGLETVHLVNDLVANAHGIPGLDERQLHTLHAGRPRRGGSRALIAAGTGLGMAIMADTGSGWQVLPTEGGHVDFAARDEREVRLWRFLAGRFGRVSVERVVSGQGLVNIHEFLREDGMPEPAWLTERLAAAPDRGAVIGEAGMKKEAAICVAALEMFLSAYGAAAGNLALTALATGGLYVGGGIAPKLIDALPGSGFMSAFTDKGRYAGLVREIPVRIVLEPKTALLGAARLALAGTGADRYGWCDLR